MVLWYILNAHSSVVSETGWSQIKAPSSPDMTVQAGKCFSRADGCHTSPCTFQVSSLSPWRCFKSVESFSTFNGNLFTSLCSPWATINWLLSRTSFLMELQTSACSVYAESGIWEVNLMPTQLFCGKEWTFNLSCHSWLCKLLSYCPIIFQREES